MRKTGLTPLATACAVAAVFMAALGAISACEAKDPRTVKADRSVQVCTGEPIKGVTCFEDGSWHNDNTGASGEWDVTAPYACKVNKNVSRSCEGWDR